MLRAKREQQHSSSSLSDTLPPTHTRCSRLSTRPHRHAGDIGYNVRKFMKQPQNVAAGRLGIVASTLCRKCRSVKSTSTITHTAVLKPLLTVTEKKHQPQHNTDMDLDHNKENIDPNVPPATQNNNNNNSTIQTPTTILKTKSSWPYREYMKIQKAKMILLEDFEHMRIRSLSQINHATRVHWFRTVIQPVSDLQMNLYLRLSPKT